MDLEEALAQALSRMTKCSSQPADETASDVDCDLFRAGTSGSSGSESSNDEQSDDQAEKSKNQNPKAVKRVGRKTRRYDHSNLLAAVRAVKNGASKSGAALFYDVPRTTLRNHITRKYTSSKMGAGYTLSLEDEQRLAEFIVKCCMKGLGRTTNDIRDLAESFVKHIGKPNRFKNGIPSLHWISRFMKRHHISGRKEKDRPGGRGVVTEAQIRNWFKELKETFEEEFGGTDIFSDPLRVFNCEEMAVFLDPSNGRVLCETGQRTVKMIQQAGETGNVTCLMTVRANGDIPPPFLCLKDTKPARERQNWEPQSYWYGFTLKGWMTADSFKQYLQKLKQWLDASGAVLPVVLTLDGHSSHANADAITWALDNGIIIVYLFPNSTHIYQPLDTHIFSSFKAYYAEELLSWQRNIPELRITAANIGNVIMRAIKRLKTTSVTNGFLHNGLVPLNPDAVNYTHCEKENVALRPTATISANSAAVESGPEAVPQFILAPADEKFAKRVLCFIDMFYKDRVNGLEVFDRDMSALITAQSEIGSFARQVVGHIRQFYKDESNGLNQFELDMKAVSASVQQCPVPSVPAQNVPVPTLRVPVQVAHIRQFYKDESNGVNPFELNMKAVSASVQQCPVPSVPAQNVPVPTLREPVQNLHVPNEPDHSVPVATVQRRNQTDNNSQKTSSVVPFVGLTVPSDLPTPLLVLVGGLPNTIHPSAKTSSHSNRVPIPVVIDPITKRPTKLTTATSLPTGALQVSAVQNGVSTVVLDLKTTPNASTRTANKTPGNGAVHLSAVQNSVSPVLLDLTASPKASTRTPKPSLRFRGPPLHASKRFEQEHQEHLAAKKLLLEERKQVKRKRKFCCGKNLKGGMVACDGPECYEWFHFCCVGITHPPAEDECWYCPDCEV